MKCVFCGQETRVINSRSGQKEVIRKRKCVSCSHIFYTCETNMDEEKGKKLLGRYKYLNKCN